MERFRQLKIGIQAWTFRQFSLSEIVERTRELGLKYLEPGYLGKSGLQPGMWDRADQARELCQQHGILLETFNARFPPEADAEAQRPVFELAKRLEVRVISGGVGPDRLAILDRLAEEYGVRIGIHNHGPGGILSDLDAIRRVLELHSPRIGLCVDTGHYLRLPLNPLEVMKAFRERVHAVHLRDMDPDRDPIRGDGGQYVEHIVGEGPLDLAGVLRLLAEWEYRGTIALEYKPNAENPMPALRTALANIEAIEEEAMLS